jgi:hypothetical protein
MPVPDAVQQRAQEARRKQTGTELFPAAMPSLMPYLASDHEHGNTAIQPDPLFPAAPWDVWVQGAKYELSQYGLRYSLKQTATFVTMTDVKQGDNDLTFYTLDLGAKWAIYSTAGGDSAGWLSSQIDIKSGLDNAGNSQSAQSNLGTLTDPTGIWSKINGVRVPELAWQQSLCDGKLVGVAGMIKQSNYFDANTYANSGRGQFLNSALVNSMVLPLPQNNLGGLVAWQPSKDWYGMVGGTVGNAPAGQLPWTDFSWNHWTLQGEFGLTPKDVLGLGPGVYRIQPFLAQVNPTEAGLSFNLQQQLGAGDSHFGWFGRFGFGSSLANGGAAAQVATGFVTRDPLEHLGLFPSRANDGAGVAFVWSQPPSNSTAASRNEYVLEAGYVLQLTPFAQLQPDLQAVWDPAYNPSASHALALQLQLVVAW